MNPGVGNTRERLAVGIVADDLTGANDSAVQFAQAGWAASLGLLPQPDENIDGGSVRAVVSDARAQSDEAARRSTATAVDTVREANATRLFLKIDSTMRGSVLAQIDGALGSWATGHPGSYAIVCPAYPGMGRSVIAGQLLVNGARVETTSIGTDPVTPVTTSDLATLLPGSVRVEMAEADAATARLRIEAATASGARIIVVDAESDADLARIAEAVAGLGPRAVPVGAAGLAIAMAAAWAPTEPTLSPSGPGVRDAAGTSNMRDPASAARAPDSAAPPTGQRRVLYVISSLHDVSRAQLQQLVTASKPGELLTLAPSLAAVLAPESIEAWARAQLAPFGQTVPAIVVVATPDARASATTNADSAADTTAGTTPSAADRESAAITIAASLALIAETVFEHVAFDALVLVGGEGARAVLDRLQARSIRVHDSIREGIPLGSITGGKANGLTVVTKAGGFGAPSVLTELASELILNPQGARS